MYGNMPHHINMVAKTQQARLEARIAPDVYAMLKSAANIEGRTLTDFVISAASAAARNTIEQTEIIRLSHRDTEIFARLLLDPPKATSALERAFVHHQALITQE